MDFVKVSSANSSVFDRVTDRVPSLVRFHSPLCGHCTSMAPEWNKLKDHKLLQNQAMAVVDADVEIAGMITHRIGKEVENKGVPSIYMIDGKKIVEYTGDRSSDDMASFYNKHAPISRKPRKTRRRRNVARRRS